MGLEFPQMINTIAGIVMDLEWWGKMSRSKIITNTAFIKV